MEMPAKPTVMECPKTEKDRVNARSVIVTILYKITSRLFLKECHEGYNMVANNWGG